MQNRDCILGVDVGGTNVKAVAYYPDGTVAAQYRLPTIPAYETGDRQPTTGPQRPLCGDTLFSIACRAISGAVKMLKSGECVRSVAVSSCGCTVLLVGENGETVGFGSEPAAAEEKQRFETAYDPAAFYRKTGYIVGYDLSGYHICAWLRNHPGFQVRYVLSIDEYLAYRLSGVPARDYSTACSCGMWDAEENDWLALYKERSGLSTEQLGRPVHSGVRLGAILPEAARQAGLPDDVVVCTGGHDYECAAFACHDLLRDRIMNITGTIDMLAYFEAGELPRKENAYDTISDLHVIPGQRSRMKETYGAIQTEWFRDRLAGDHCTWQDLTEGMRACLNDASLTELYLPKVFGTCIPRIRDDIYGAFVGLQRETNAYRLFYSMLVGMAFETRRMISYMREGENGRPVIHVGGASKDAFWCQIKADVLGQNVVVPKFTEASALGAAMLGGVGCGLYASHIAAAQAVVGVETEIYRPDPARAAYFHDIYERVYLPIGPVMEAADEKRNAINREHSGRTRAEDRSARQERTIEQGLGADGTVPLARKERVLK